MNCSRVADASSARRDSHTATYANAVGENGGGAAGDFGDEQCGGVVAAELQFAAEFFGHNVNAAFFDFQLADVAVAQVLCE